MLSTLFAAAILGGSVSAIPVISVGPQDFPELTPRAGNSDVIFCTDSNACNGGTVNCPSYGEAVGYPQCNVIQTATDAGYPVVNGQTQITFYFQPPDPSCRYIVRSPATTTEPDCGSIIHESAGGYSCDPVLVNSDFAIQFCCGVDDCNSAGAKRSLSFSNLALMDRATGEPLAINQTAAGWTSEKDLEILSKRALNKRDTFTVTRNQYTIPGQSMRRSSDVTCGTLSCSVSTDRSVSQTRTISASVSVGDPWGVVTATVGYSFATSSTISVTDTYNIPAGQTGFVQFTPYLVCYDGYFNGDSGNPVSVCGPENTNGVLQGDEGLVTISS